jgi:uncharacterized protein DUF1707
MTGPRAEGASRDGLRASRADRERVVDVLKAAYVQERLTKDELTERVGLTLASQTYAELAGVTADLPAGLVPAPRTASRSRRRPPAAKTAAIATLIVPPPVVLTLAYTVQNVALLKFLALMMPFFFMAWIAAGAQAFANWYDKRSAGRLPPPSARGVSGPGRAVS